jgi:hypothetical protein
MMSTSQYQSVINIITSKLDAVPDSQPAKRKRLSRRIAVLTKEMGQYLTVEEKKNDTGVVTMSDEVTEYSTEEYYREAQQKKFQADLGKLRERFKEDDKKKEEDQRAKVSPDLQKPGCPRLVSCSQFNSDLPPIYPFFSKQS